MKSIVSTRIYVFFISFLLFTFISACSTEEQEDKQLGLLPEKFLGQWDVIETHGRSYTPGYIVWTFSPDHYSYVEYVGSTGMGSGAGADCSLKDGKLMLGPENGYNELFTVQFTSADELKLVRIEDDMVVKLLKSPVKLYGKWRLMEGNRFDENQNVVSSYSYTTGSKEISWEFDSRAGGYFNWENSSSGFGYSLKNNILSITTENTSYKVKILDDKELHLENSLEELKFIKVSNTSD